MYPRILVATDGSDCSNAAVAEGVRLAKELGSRVTFLHVIDVTRFAGDAAFDVDRAMRDLQRSADDVLSRAKAIAETACVPCEAKTTEGLPGQEIARESLARDLIVVGGHGRGVLAQLVLGSVTQAVLHHAKRPVLVVTPAAKTA